MIVAQVALSLVLLVGATLFVGTFRNLVTLDPGFRRTNVLVTSVDLSPYKHPKEKRGAAQERVLARLRSVPGVLSAAAVAIVPLTGGLWNDVIFIDGNPTPPGTKRLIANFNQVSADYFRTMEMPLLLGRDFDERDTPTSPSVAIVTETFSKRFLGGANPVGRTVSHARSPGKPDAVYQIVGMARDSKYRDLREEIEPLVYVAWTQSEDPGQGLSTVLRSSMPSDEAARSVKAMMAEAWPAALLRFRPLERVVREALRRERLMATLSGFFGLLAAVLAMVGLYGVVSYMVTRRRNEIGVRMALGADRGRIVSMVVKEAGTLLSIGLGIGTALAVVGSLATKALLYGFTPGDPRALALSILSLAAVAVAASVVPARRAATVDPAQALRE